MNQNQINQLEKTIIKAIFETGEYLNENTFKYTGLEWKSKEDPVTDMDKEAETMIKQSIAKHYDAQFIGEEHGTQGTEKNLKIYVDPLDGTKSYIKGELNSTICVAAEYKGNLILSQAYDFTRDILYHANPEGAYLTRKIWNGKKQELPMENIQGLNKTNLAFTDWDNIPELDPEKFSVKKQSGSIALTMAQVATGIIDGMIKKPYKKNDLTDIADITAGYYLLKQAGITMETLEGNKYSRENLNGGLIAIHPEKHEKIITELIKNQVVTQQEYHNIIYSEWMESERGWGERPDGCSLHTDLKNCELFIEKYWETMPKETPDEYSKPVNSTIAKASKTLLERIKKEDYGLRIYLHEETNLKKNKELII